MGSEVWGAWGWGFHRPLSSTSSCSSNSTTTLKEGAGAHSPKIRRERKQDTVCGVARRLGYKRQAWSPSLEAAQRSEGQRRGMFQAVGEARAALPSGSLWLPRPPFPAWPRHCCRFFGLWWHPGPGSGGPLLAIVEGKVPDPAPQVMSDPCSLPLCPAPTGPCICTLGALRRLYMEGPLKKTLLKEGPAPH